MKAGGPEPVHDLQQVVLAGSVDQNWCRRRDLNPDHPLTKRFTIVSGSCSAVHTVWPCRHSFQNNCAERFRVFHVQSTQAISRRRRRAEAPVGSGPAKRPMTFDAYLDGQLLAQDLLPATVQDAFQTGNRRRRSGRSKNTGVAACLMTTSVNSNSLYTARRWRTNV